ncbi:MAG: tetratricopeptide repeat protein [Opitutaceae bacterium]
MPTATLLSSSRSAEILPENRTRDPESELACGALFEAVRFAVRVWQEQPAQVENRRELHLAIQRAAEAIAGLPRKKLNSREVEDAKSLVRELAVSGLHDYAVAPAQLAVAGKLAGKGWPGLLAAMLQVPAWQWPDAPSLQTVPASLWSDYVGWLFAPPQGFAALGDAERYATHILKRLEELVRWVNRGPGESVVAAVLDVFTTQTSVIPLYFSAGSLRRHAELRGQLLLRARGVAGDRYDPPAMPRLNRRLKVGFVNRHFASQTETYTTLPTFEQLDPEQFEVLLFAHQSNGSALETYCRQCAVDFVMLTGSLDDQLATLRAAELDVVVFGTNLTAVCNEVTLLALHRVAPLQVVNNSSCITSGLPEVDLYVSGTLTEAARASEHFSERLGLLPGPAHAFNYEADRQEPFAACSRADFGVPDEAPLFVSAANYFKIIPEMQHAWAELLASVPGSHLLVHPFNPNWSSSYPIERFRADFERVLAEHGIEAARLAISTQRFPSRSDVKELLALGDVYLDTFPFGGVNSLVDPLELGLPVVAWEGQPFRSRMGGALLRSLQLNDLIATNAASYQAIATKLATDPTYRQACGARIRGRMEATPIFLDTLAASEAFGDLIVTAYDQLVAGGREAFRLNPNPLRTGTTANDSTNDIATQARAVLRSLPANPTARHALGRVHLEAGRFDRAVTYLLAALQGEEGKADLWLDLALALRAVGRTTEAIQALEAGLRIDDTLLEGWVMLAELAQAVGANDLMRDAADVAQKLAPSDPRLTNFLAA